MLSWKVWAMGNPFPLPSPPSKHPPNKKVKISSKIELLWLSRSYGTKIHKYFDIRLIPTKSQSSIHFSILDNWTFRFAFPTN